MDCTGVGAVAKAVGRSSNNAHCVLQLEGLHPKHLQRALSLLPTHQPSRVHFAQWYSDQCRQEAHFLFYVLFTDEAYFT